MSDVVPLKTGAKIGAIVPTTIEEVFRLATAIAKSGIAPKGMEKAEALTVAIMHGLEIGLPPMQAVQRIAVVNGRPTVWGDAIPALLWARGFGIKEMIDGTGDERTAYCTVTRPSGEAITKAFSIADAKAAGLWGKIGPWKQYPDRMLAMRARGFAARDGASDALGGLYISEEIADVHEMRDVTPRKSSAAAKRAGTDKLFNEINCQIEEARTVEALKKIKDDTYAEEWAALPNGWANLLNEAYEVRLNELAPSAEVA